MRSVTIVVAVAVVLACVGLTAAGASSAEVFGVVMASSTLAAAPANVGLSSEAQHVINALEAHFVAVKNAIMGGGGAALVDHAEEAFQAVRQQLGKWGANFSADHRELGDVGAQSESASPAGQPRLGGAAAAGGSTTGKAA
jgi:hypothetical protein